MSFCVEWLIEPSIILTVVEDHFSIDQMRKQNVEAIALMDDSPRAGVHQFIDLRAMTDHPVDASELRNKQTLMQHPKLGYTVFYGASPADLGKFFMQVTLVISHTRLLVTSDLESAIDYFSRRDASLDAIAVRAAIRGVVESAS